MPEIVEKIITFLFIGFAVLLPYLFLCLVPFWGNFKVPKRKFYISTAIFSICYTIIVFIAFKSNFLTYWWSVQVFNNVSTGSIFVFCWFMIKTPISKLLFVHLSVRTYTTYVCGVAYHFEAKYFPYITDNLLGFYYEVIHSLVFLVTLPFVYKFFHKLVKPAIANSAPYIWKYLWIIPAIFVTSISIFNEMYDPSHFASLQYLSIILLFAIGSFLIYYVITKMVTQTEKNTLLMRNIATTEKQLELQSENYKMLQSHISETKKARHDLRHHLSVIQSFINTGEKEKLTEYINKYKASLPNDSEIMFCENFTINSLLCHYFNIARSEGIQVDVNLELPENMGISDIDLCIIFGNCIENAIEACRRIESGKFIKINSRLKEDMLAITIDNSFDGVVKKAGDAFLSMKHDGEGIGVSSVKGVARKYGEIAQFEVKGNIFQASIMLRVQPIKV